MTPAQKRKHNDMIDVLRAIARDFPSLSQLSEESERNLGANYVDALETVYRSIQVLAGWTVENARKL